jgi:hypothetical protein
LLLWHLQAIYRPQWGWGYLMKTENLPRLIKWWRDLNLAYLYTKQPGMLFCCRNPPTSLPPSFPPPSLPVCLSLCLCLPYASGLP